MQLQERLQAGWFALYRVVHRQLEMPYWCVLIHCTLPRFQGPHPTQDACFRNLSDRGTHALLFSQNTPPPSAFRIHSIAELLMAFEVDKGAVFSLINLVINPTEECIAVIPTVLPIPLAGGGYITTLSVSLCCLPGQKRREG